MSLRGFDVITTHSGAAATSTGLITTGYTLSEQQQLALARASLGGRIIPRVLCTSVAGSGSLTISSLSISMDGGTRWRAAQTMNIAVSGTGMKGAATDEVVCLIPKDTTNIRWDTSVETLAAGDYVTVSLALVCQL
jgi:hypothetical protein